MKRINMNFITRALLLSMILVAHVCFADDNPEVDQGAATYNQMTCIDNATQECINNACLTSEDIDCEENCSTMAQDKCQEAIDE